MKTKLQYYQDEMTRILKKFSKKLDDDDEKVSSRTGRASSRSKTEKIKRKKENGHSVSSIYNVYMFLVIM